MSKGKVTLSLSDKNWFTKYEAMAYLNRGEEVFDREIRPHVNIYCGTHYGAHNQEIYKRQELDYIQSKKIIHKVDIYHETF